MFSQVKTWTLIRSMFLAYEKVVDKLERRSIKKRSERNSVNRSKYAKALMPRTGSKPIRQIIWDDLGGSKGNKPTLVDVFYTTRKKGNSLPNAETIQKHAEIQETMEKEPSHSFVQVAQKVLKSKSRDRVVGLGGGITLIDMIGPQPSREELQIELTAAQKKMKILQIMWRLFKKKTPNLRVAWVWLKLK
ncbi:uncharacterized protein LOC110707564 isoform X2 [Chenopodium quinoa]|nr:uncharacterized protein LOC110707564 isoform X2 [Chenopodium quinoa]